MRLGCYSDNANGENTATLISRRGNEEVREEV